MESAREALALLAEMGLEDAVIAGTTYVNIATACNAFGDYERSRELFEKARAVYEGSEHVEPQLLGGLYNNMALTYAALGRYEEALALYEKAVGVMADVPDGELEQAITFLNMANAVEAQLGMEEGESRIYELVDRAEELLESKGREMLGPEGSAGGSADGAGGRGPQSNGSAAKEAALPLRDKSREERARIGYYAFVCEKCAPTFEYYGYFLTAEALKETAEKIYREE